MPFSPRSIVMVLAAALVLTGCGGGQNITDDLPPMPPTMTPEPEPTPEPAPTLAVPPTPTLEGETLVGLEEGQEVEPPDQRYSIILPDLWVPGSAPTADIAYRESGGLTEDHEYSYNVMREQLPAGISDAQAYAESGRQAVEGTFSDTVTLSMEPVNMGGIQAVRWVYTITITADTVFVHQVYVVDGTTGFLLTGSAPADGDIEAAHDLFDAITGSFSFPRG